MHGFGLAIFLASFLASVSWSWGCLAAGPTTDKFLPPKDLLHAWTHGLQNGPNGPIPVIVVDQFGYPARAQKVAVIRDPQVGYDSSARFTPGKNYALVELSTGKIIKEAAPVAWKGGDTDAASGDKAWWFDFSDIEMPGRYVVMDLDKGVRSADFVIGDTVYKDVMKHAVRTFFYQRAGFDKKIAFAGVEWADRASHLGAGQDGQSSPWPATPHPGRSTAGPQLRDLQGGWYDAGDYNKYTSWTARNIIILLRAFDENPQAFSDTTGIPESGNGVPDILDEVKWGLDWLLRMQSADGSLLCVQALASASPPSAAQGKSYYGPATTSATLMGAAAMAYASKIFAARSEKALQTYAADLAKRAKTAWQWADKYPSVLYYNNDDAKQPGSKGLAAGQQEMSDPERRLAKMEAATYLFELAKEPMLKEFIEANYRSIVPNYGPTQWDAEGQELLLYYTRLAGISAPVKTQILENFLAGMRANFSFADVSTWDPYRSPMKDYTWGSNKAKAGQARLFQLLALYGETPDMQAKGTAAALEYSHYIHGVNPLGLVYLTNMAAAGAKHSARTMFHAWFAHGTPWSTVQAGLPGPPPGYLVGGPNPQHSKDGCCTAAVSRGSPRCHSEAAAAMCSRSYAPPIGQPPLKSYLQFNDGWPANSWAITEPSTLYQAYYIRLLATFVR